MVFQDPLSSLNPGLTLGRSIGEPLRARGVKKAIRDETVRDLAARTGLSLDLLHRRPGEVSGGQNQRACIARALSSDPSFLVLDEPLTALDAVSQSQVVTLLARIKEKTGLTYFLITHNLPLARRIGTHVAVMYAGTIVEQAPAESFFSAPRHPYSCALLSSVLRPGFWPGERVVLPGEMPPLGKPPKGCVFHPRCPKKETVCAESAPPVHTTEKGHTVHCHFPTAPDER
jgi:oligopeptide/dipeptide ABC transporter ATP-binding protein